MSKKLQLGVSTVIIIIVGLIYGLDPSRILPLFFDFSIDNLELKNQFRGTMGLYLEFAIYWIIGINKDQHLKNAIISNVIFMGGLALGRLVSTIVDGFSLQYFIGLLMELTLMIWGLYNLQKN